MCLSSLMCLILWTKTKSISRLLKIVGLFCRIQSLFQSTVSFKLVLFTFDLVLDVSDIVNTTNLKETVLCKSDCILQKRPIILSWFKFDVSFKFHVSDLVNKTNLKETVLCKSDWILQKRPIILRSLLIDLGFVDNIRDIGICDVVLILSQALL